MESVTLIRRLLQLLEGVSLMLNARLSRRLLMLAMLCRRILSLF